MIQWRYLILLLLSVHVSAFAHRPQVVQSTARLERALLGKHKFSLQWISWRKFGVAHIKRDKNGLFIQAKQALNGDWVSVQGRIKIIDAKAFSVTGKVVTRVSHINSGLPCERTGTYEFRATQKRKYWRMQQMANPCDSVVDYIDVFFK